MVRFGATATPTCHSDLMSTSWVSLDFINGFQRCIIRIIGHIYFHYSTAFQTQTITFAYQILYSLMTKYTLHLPTMILHHRWSLHFLTDFRTNLATFKKYLSSFLFYHVRILNEFSPLRHLISKYRHDTKKWWQIRFIDEFVKKHSFYLLHRLNWNYVLEHSMIESTKLIRICQVYV